LERVVGYDVLVSDCVDEMPEPGARSYGVFARLVSMAARVLTTSPATVESLQVLNPTTTFVANGVDATLLVDPEGVRLRRHTPRRIGYVGVVSARTDVVLLQKIAEACPGALLVLVGWVDPDREADVEPLRRLPNVRFAGRVTFAEVPHRIDEFDVCVIPHLDNALGRSQSALKLYQYLARGKAVVTTPVNGLENVAGVVASARGHDEFVASVRQALAADQEDPAAVRARVACAADNTWDLRVASVWRHIAPHASHV
jgi:glycosyltransferase involved in cell wall biosynthesis